MIVISAIILYSGRGSARLEHLPNEAWLSSLSVAERMKALAELVPQNMHKYARHIYAWFMMREFGKIYSLNLSGVSGKWPNG